MKEERNILKRCRWSSKSVIAAVLMAFVLSSCAGLFISSDAEYAFEEGILLFNQGRFSEAIPYFDEAISYEPDFYSAYLYLGRSYLNLHNYGKAIPPLRKAYRLSPRDFQKEVADLLIDALLGAAFSELKEGDLQASLGYIREVLSADPKSKKIKNDISRVLVAVAAELFKSGKAREAIREYREAIKIDPDNTGAYIGLAKTLLKNGEFIKALEAAEKALSLDPGSKEALNIIKDLLKK